MMQPTPQNFTDWVRRDALPLWTTVGIDASSQTSWEALAHDGTPCEGLLRRVRVQARQAFCFARSDDSRHKALALALFQNAMRLGFAHSSGNFAATLAPDLQVGSAPHDLYDLAFMLLAVSALLEAGHNVADDLRRLEKNVARLKAPRGWYENAAQGAPRRQNPHMHLFEASTELFRVTGAERFLAMADECLGLFKEVFLQADGHVLEYFTQEWQPVPPAAQDSEPGHTAEWVYLIDAYENVTGRSSGIDLGHIFEALLQSRDASGLLPDSLNAEQATRRLWPQTEFLKASVAMVLRGSDLALSASPARIAGLIFEDYLNTATKGGWYDRRDAQGQLVSDTMPASSLYHLVLAEEAYRRLKPKP